MQTSPANASSAAGPAVDLVFFDREYYDTLDHSQKRLYLTRCEAAYESHAPFYYAQLEALDDSKVAAAAARVAAQKTKAASPAAPPPPCTDASTARQLRNAPLPASVKFNLSQATTYGEVFDQLSKMAEVDLVSFKGNLSSLAHQEMKQFCASTIASPLSQKASFDALTKFFTKNGSIDDPGTFAHCTSM
jgi:hypothetical protein